MSGKTRSIASMTAFTAVLFFSSPKDARADIIPPPMPDDLIVDAGHKPYLIGHASGTQNYICLPSASGFAWILFGPQATLFNDKGEQLTTHFLSRNPMEDGTPRATWQHSQDTSSVWAVADRSSTDANYVAPGAIPWLRLRVVGFQSGPGASDTKLTATTFIQRLNTAGGIAPATGCSVASDVGKRALVPYTTDYIFYRQ